MGLLTVHLGSNSKATGTMTTSLGRSSNGTLAAATSTASSIALTPSVTSKTLIGTTGDNKPSTVAIVVPLAIFAAALAGLIFSLRQRAKTKQTKGQSKTGQNEPALKRMTSNESSTSGASGGGSVGSRMTDLEWAMEFITGARVPKSPRLTPLPPTIESKRRARRENRADQADTPPKARELSSGRVTLSTASSIPAVDRLVRQQDHSPAAMAPPVDQASGSSVVPVSHQEVSHPTPYTVYPPGIPCGPVIYQPSTVSHAEIDHSTHAALASAADIHPHAPHATAIIPPTEQTTNLSSVEVPRPPAFTQQQVPPPSAYMSVTAATSATYLATAAPPVILASAPPSASSPVPVRLPPLPVLPASLRVAQPQVPAVSPVMPQSKYSEHAQLQPQVEYESVISPLTRPDVPYSTRPQTTQVYAASNPYDAIVKALRTPRLG
jgi:hypothetical protein